MNRTLPNVPRKRCPTEKWIAPPNHDHLPLGIEAFNLMVEHNRGCKEPKCRMCFLFHQAIEIVLRVWWPDPTTGKRT